jgi:hypothetical protein
MAMMRQLVASAWLLLVGILLALLGAALASPPPARAAGGPLHCAVGAWLEALHGIDVADGTFQAKFWYFSRCRSAAWLPLTSEEYTTADSVHTSLYSDQREAGVYWDQLSVDGTFREEWDLHNYPFDRHTLTLDMSDAVYDVRSAVYDADARDSSADPTIHLNGWTITGYRVLSLVVPYNTTFGDPTLPPGSPSYYSTLRVEIDIARSDIGNFLKLTAAVYISVLFALMTLLFRAHMIGERLAIIGAALFTVVLNLVVVSAAIGNQPGLTLLDEVHIVGFLFILIAALIALASWLALDRKQVSNAEEAAEESKKAASVQRINRRSPVVALIAYIAINVVLVALAVFGA